MATGTKEQCLMFIEHNQECEVAGLLEWIIELLPQQDFDDYVTDIKTDLENNEG